MSKLFKRCSSAVLSLLLVLSSIIPMTTAYAAEGNLNLSTATAQELVNDMKSGWNLGNALDCYDWQQKNVESYATYKSSYQTQLIYSTVNYSGWDAAGYTYFANDINTTNWKMNTLNSSPTGKCGSFSLQLINNGLKSSTNPVVFSITNATFTKADGTVITLSNWIKSYSSVVSGNTTGYASVNLSGVAGLSTTADLIGGTLSVSSRITSYPITSNATALASAQTSSLNRYEQLWTNPKTTKAMIDAVSAKGFKSIRIPASWYDHVGTNGTIDAVWLARVAEVVNYALSNNMYVILNVHHDAGNGGYIHADTDSYTTDVAKLTGLWSQIATYFKDYDARLLFEGTNEIINSDNNWDWGTKWQDFKCVHDLNQAFINTVRNTGSNNVSRFLVVSTFGASSDSCSIQQSFYTPYIDSAMDKLILSVHNYSSDAATISSLMTSLANFSDTYNIPIIIDEFGTPSSATLSTRVASAANYISAARANGITCFWWDDNGSYQLLNRSTLSWVYPDIANALVTN